MKSELLTLQEAAQECKCSVGMLRLAYRNGNLKICRLGVKLIRIRREDLEDFWTQKSTKSEDSLDATENTSR